MSHSYSRNEPFQRFIQEDEFELKSPAGADPNTNWVVRDFVVGDGAYRVAVEELPMDNGDKRYTLVIKCLDADEKADVFRLFSIPDKMDAYKWLRDHMISTLASKHTTLDGACGYIQDNLGVTDGGFAGHYFTDEEMARDFQNQKTMHAYLIAESRFNEPDPKTGSMLLSAYEAVRYAHGMQNDIVETPIQSANSPKI